MARMVYLWFFYYFLQCCCTQYVTCSVTQDDGQTAYKVQEFWGTQCEYQWANATNHLLVNHVDDPDEVVVNHNSTALTIKGCLDLIHYRRDCISEGKPRIANCTTNCSQSAGLRQTRRGGKKVPKLYKGVKKEAPPNP